MDPSDILAYYSHVLKCALTIERGQIRANCIRHPDSNGSLIIDPRNGAWTCRCGSGSIHDYEMRRAGEEGGYDQWGEADHRIRQIVSHEKAVAPAA